MQLKIVFLYTQTLHANYNIQQTQRASTVYNRQNYIADPLVFVLIL